MQLSILLTIFDSIPYLVLYVSGNGEITCACQYIVVTALLLTNWRAGHLHGAG